MSKRKKHFYSTTYIAKIYEINNDIEKFYVSTKEWLEGNLDNNIFIKINNQSILRLLNLLKYSDAIIDDHGNFSNVKWKNILKLMKKQNIDDYVKENIVKFEKDLLVISEIISEYLNLDLTNQYKIVSKINYDFDNMINHADSFNGKFITESIEKNSFLLSVIIRQIIKNKNELDIFKLNAKTNSNISLDSFHILIIIKMWKYGDASINKKNKFIGKLRKLLGRRSPKIQIKADTEFVKSFVINRELTTNNYNLMSNLNAYNTKSIEEFVKNDISGLSEMVFAGINTVDSLDKFNVSINEFKDNILFGIKIYDWLRAMYVIKLHILNNIKDIDMFIPLEDILNIDNEIFKIIIQKTTFNLSDFRSMDIDLLDKPIVHINGKYYVYKPAIFAMDPKVVIYKIMRQDKNWNNKIGYNFEGEIENDLIDSEKQFLHNVRYRDDGIEHEIDFITEDEDLRNVFIECKTFTIPYSLKDYRLNLDKLYSSKYIEHAYNHFNSLKKNKNHKNILKKLEKNNSNTKYEFINKQVNWENMYGVFTSNYILPNSYLKEFDEDMNYVYWFDIHKLFHKIPLNELHMYRINKDKIEPFNILNKNIKIRQEFTKEIINNISINQPSKDNVDFQFIKNPRTLSIGEQSVGNINYTYYK